MVEIYTSPSCSSCRKAKKWLDEYGIKYIEKNLFVTKITREDIKQILEKTENGFEDIISTRSKAFKENFKTISMYCICCFIKASNS